MSVFVVDASVVVKWFVPETGTDAARQWLDAPHDYFAPDLLFPEIGNTLWKKVRRGELRQDDARSLLKDISAVGIEAVPMRPLLTDATGLAVATGMTVYDAMYVTLAVRLDAPLVTGDDKLRKTMGEHPLLAPHVRSVADLAE